MDNALRESYFARAAGRAWAWFCRNATHSAFFSALSGSRIVMWMCHHLSLVTAGCIALLYVVPHAYFNNQYSFFIMLLLSGLLLVAAVNGFVPGIAVHRMGLYALVFGLCVVFGFVFSLSVSQSLRFFLFYVTAFLGLLLTRSVLHTRRDLLTFILVILGAVELSALYGLYQSFAGVEVKLSQVDLALNAGMPGRIFSFFENPNNYAEVLVLTLPFFAALFFIAKTKLQKYAVALSAVLPLLCLVLTYSRTSWMAFAAALVVFFYFTYRWVVPLLFVGGFAAFPLLPFSIRQRILSIFAGTDSSILYRATIREQYYPMVHEYWKTGMGLGSDIVKNTVIAYYEERPELGVLYWQVAPHAHNLFLQIWSELGIIGAASFCGACIAFVRKSVTTLFHTTQRNFLAAAGFAGILGTLIVGFGEYIWFYPRVMLLFWLVTGVTLSALRLGTDTDDSISGAADAS